MYVPTRYDQVKETATNPSLFISQKSLKENNFLDEDFLKNLCINELRKLARKKGASTNGKKSALIQRILKHQDKQWHTASSPDRRLQKNEKYYVFFIRWNNPPKNWFDKILQTCPFEYVLRVIVPSKRIRGYVGFLFQQRPNTLFKSWKGVHLEKPGSLKRCYRFCRDLSPRDDNTHIQGFERYFKAYNGKISEVQRVRWKKEVLDIACVTEQEYENAHAYECPKCFGDGCKECMDTYQLQLQLTVLKAFYQWKGWKWKKDKDLESSAFLDELSADSESED